MFKLILVAIMAYLGYSLFLRYTNTNKINKSKDQKASKKYSKMKISDAEFKDIDSSEQ